MAIKTHTASSNGVMVSITEENGNITNLSLTAPEFPAEYDEKGAASDVLGTVDDNRSRKTVYGAFAAIKYTQDNFDDKIEDLNSDMGHESNGISVKIKQESGVITNVIVGNRLLGTVGDTADSNTIYGAKAASNDVLGKSTDDSNQKTVYGAFAAIQGVKDCLEGIQRIEDDQIMALFCS